MQRLAGLHVGAILDHDTNDRAVDARLNRNAAGRFDRADRADEHGYDALLHRLHDDRDGLAARFGFRVAPGARRGDHTAQQQRTDSKKTHINLPAHLRWYTPRAFKTVAGAQTSILDQNQSPGPGSIRLPSEKRDIRKRVRSCTTGRPSTRSAMTRPAPGPMPNPWPLKPVAT